jgi:GNAT superfamily N-acetyltransferase
MDPTHITLRSAAKSDFEACRRVYFAEIGWINERLALDPEVQATSFQSLWDSSQVRIIQFDGTDAGWLQIVPREDAYFLGSLFIDRPFQGRGIGTEVMRRVLEEGARRGQPVCLSVVKFNPARRLYERLGFTVTHEDERKVHMSWEPSTGTGP